MSIENLKTFDPFAEADEDTGQVKQSQQDYIHIRIQRMFSFPQGNYTQRSTVRFANLNTHTALLCVVSTCPRNPLHNKPAQIANFPQQSAMAARP
jgi:hypothetical protein